MACYHPMVGWYGAKLNASGKRPIVFNLHEAYNDRPLPVPCGKCVGCQLEKSRQWAVRCVHEASLHPVNCFVTLTYREEDLPPGGTLVPEHFVNFMKRLRFKYGPGIRFFHCGEYGELLERPHHHALLFNHDFKDKLILKRSSGVGELFESGELSKLWPYGFSSIGTVTFQSAGYVARYAMKKVYGTAAVDWYKGRVPEYLTMSRRPGIGRGWIDKFYRDVYPSDELVSDGAISKPPRYYDEVVARHFPSGVETVKIRRRALGSINPDGTGKRLNIREEVKEASVKFLSRSMEKPRDS